MRKLWFSALVEAGLAVVAVAVPGDRVSERLHNGRRVARGRRRKDRVREAVSGNVNGVSIQSRTRGTGPWGTYLLRNVRITGNTIEMTGGSQSTGMVQNSGAEVPAGQVVFTGNRYVLDALGAQRFTRFGTKLTSTGWRQSGLDTVSAFLAN